MPRPPLHALGDPTVRAPGVESWVDATVIAKTDPVPVRGQGTGTRFTVTIETDAASEPSPTPVVPVTFRVANAPDDPRCGDGRELIFDLRLGEFDAMLDTFVVAVATARLAGLIPAATTLKAPAAPENGRVVP